MSATIHGHEIMQIIHAAPTPLTRETLAEEVHDRFGADARFHTCSADRMTLDDLLAFLAHRGKIVEAEGGLRTDIGLMCSHHD